MQYDLLLTQNVAAAGVEFSEKYVNLAKGGLLSALADGTPTVLAAGTNGYMLVRDDVEVTGLKWVAISGGHTQGTDLGTTSTIFELDSDGFKIELTAESTGDRIACFAFVTIEPILSWTDPSVLLTTLFLTLSNAFVKILLFSS